MVPADHWVELASSDMISLEVTGSDNQTSCITRHSASEMEGDSFIAKNVLRNHLKQSRVLLDTEDSLPSQMQLMSKLAF